MQPEGRGMHFNRESQQFLRKSTQKQVSLAELPRCDVTDRVCGRRTTHAFGDAFSHENLMFF